MLGPWSYAPLGLLIVDPVLPAWLPELTLRDLRIGRGRVSIRFKRDRDGSTHYRVVERHGPVRVVRQPPPDDLSATLATRLWDFVGSLLSGH